MSNGKYSNTLTVFLIIAIIGIIGLLVFLGIDAYNRFNLLKEGSEAVSKFDELIPDINTDVQIADFDTLPSTNTVEENTISMNDIEDPFANVTSNTNNSSSQSAESQKPKKVYYKGFVQVGNITIGKTGLSSPVLEKATKPAIEVAVAIQAGPGLNEIGNTVIAGHNYRNGTLFSDNKNIKVGDKITIKDTTGRTITYVVYEKYETDPQDASYINRDTDGKREITLYSCNDDSSMRIIIKAREQ